MHAYSSKERRTRRSNDIMTALHYQLAFARHQGGFDALVLADSAGCVVAGAGAWATCELLAAYAPLLAHDDDAAKSHPSGCSTPSGVPPLRVFRSGSQRLETAPARYASDAPMTDVEVQKFAVDGGDVLLCSRGGGDARAPSLSRARSGCLRILGS